MAFKKINNDEARRMVLQKYQFSKNSQERVDFLSEYEISYKKYLMFKDDRKKALEEAKQDWRSNLFVPMTFTIIETFVPHVLLSIVGSDVIVSMKATNRDDFDKAKVAEKTTTMQAYEDDIKEKYEMFIKDAATGGLSVGLPIWFTDKIKSMKVERRQRKFMGITVPGMTQDVEVASDRYRFNGPKLFHVDIHDYYPDVSKTRIDDMSFAIREFLLYQHEVKEYLDQGIFTDEKEVKQLLSDKDTNDRLSGDVVRRMETLDKAVEGVDGMRSVLVKEYWEKDRLIYVINDKYVVRNTDNPNWHKSIPFIDMKAVPIPHKYYPKSLPWTVNDLQNLANDTFNQKADNVRYLLNSMYAVVEDEILYNSDLVPRPGGKVRVKTDPNAIQQIRHENVTPDAYTQASEINVMGQNASGIFNIVKGQMERKETATVGALLANAAGTRLQATIMRMAETFVKKHFMFMVELNRQYMTEEKAIEMLGEDASGYPEFKYITRFDMPQGGVNYVPQVVLEQKKEIDRKASLDYFNLFYGKPEFDQHALAEAAAQFVPYLSKTPILVPREAYNQRMEQMARQQESLSLKGSKEEAVIPPVAGQVRDRALPGVRQQMQSPELARRREITDMEDLARSQTPTGK